MILLNIAELIWLALGCAAIALPTRHSTLKCSRYLNILAALCTLSSVIFYSNLSDILFATKFAPENLHFAFQCDALSRFFVFLLSLSVLGISGFGQSYFHHFTLKQQKIIQAAQSFFILAMLMVFTSANTFTFLFAWELMTLSSYFLVTFNEVDKSIRQAGFLYLGIAHLGFLGIAIAFFLLGNSPITLPLGNFIFTLALFGFGAKAGLFPLHVWLPEAHPAAPSPISALMSGVMLKTAIYGLIRFSFYWLLPYQQVWWGYVLITVGLLSMLMGVIHAALQTDMKRLLAYSSIENVGFIILTLGFAIVFYQYHQYLLSDVALLITLLHSLSHSLFKSLLFLSTGSILHATGERNIGKLGGLIQKMPWVSSCALIGCLSMAGLPLFSGFISEWLFLRIFFSQGSSMPFDFAILSAVIVAISVLVFALAGFVIVKFFGIAFLGQPRESQLIHAKPATGFERASLIWFALWSLVIGLWPSPFVSMLQKILYGVSDQFTFSWLPIFAIALPQSNTVNGDTFIPFLLALTLIVCLLFIYLLLRKFSIEPIRRNLAWGCGFNVMTSRMQESAEGFSQPFKQIFAMLIQSKLILPKADDKQPYYSAQISEKIWPIFYKPMVKGVLLIVSITRWIQQGKISVYLTYMGFTLLALLIGIVWL